MTTANLNARSLMFGEGLTLKAGANCLHIHSPVALRTLSSALIGGGFGWRRDFCNFHVDKHYACETPGEELEGWLAKRNLDPGQALAMMTAVPLDRFAVAEADAGSTRVLAVTTAGVGNAVDITAPVEGDARLVAGTINLLIFIDGHLTDGALVNVVLSATEAKVHALTACGVQDAEYGTPATGTSTDCLAIAATQRGMSTGYAGSGTRLGRAIGDTVFRSICDSLGAGGESS
ncbi:adenosylcobinamide amidohydrolase [Halomonas halmophila]|uniref:Adenosylcobinamide amidohydrolase n=1 Tax=Halomonas halmophila TaxID=252 RepID=A0A4Y4F2K7_9GAMM|nr:adenosylcobinamide amidohydrolase [Halomonas halmophila]GED22074.1 hypothetical protein HHA01_10510 [Halomonas halmophila]